MNEFVKDTVIGAYPYEVICQQTRGTFGVYPYTLLHQIIENKDGMLDRLEELSRELGNGGNPDEPTDSMRRLQAL